ncbi:unnamed protein product, partial [Symbiodinium necroappetens]
MSGDEQCSPDLEGGESAGSPHEDSDGSWIRPTLPGSGAGTSAGVGISSGPPALFAPPSASSSSTRGADLDLSHGQRMSYENFLASAISQCIQEDSLKLPWERGIWAPPAHLKPSFRHHAVGVADLFVPASQPAVPAFTAAASRSYPAFMKKRLRLGTLHRDESEVRALQLRKLRTIVLQDPSASELGCALVNAAGALQDEELVVRSFRDAFTSKSTGTLVKRVSSLWPFCSFLNDKGVPPLNFVEELLYDFLNKLREAKRGATAASSLLSALRFIHGVVKIKDQPKDLVFSARCEGLARGEMSKKRPTKQSEVLTSDQVWSLEKLVVERAPSLFSLIGGQILFALFACARWDDSLHLVEIILSRHGRIVLVETATSKHKTSQASHDRSLLLPLICLGQGLYEKPWADAWVASRAHFGMDATGPALPTYCERTSSFGQGPMSATEATLWLRELLCMAGASPMDVESITSHGLKATLLSWISKHGGWSERDQKLMGHHFDRESRSVLIYSRDSYTPLAVQTRRLLDKIIDGAMATSELDSEVEFRRRALQLGVSSTNIDSLIASGFKTFGQYAFSVPYQPGSADESPLVDMLTSSLSGEPDAGQLACLRRLFWEAHGLAVRDLRLRQEHGSDSVIKKLPTSERTARADAQRRRLTGITWSPETEPSHQLVDRFVSMVEEQTVIYVRPELCTSRAQETLQVKQAKTFALGSDGQLRITAKGDDLECSTAGEWKLRMALQRKSLAMDLAGLASFQVSEAWHTYLFT